MTMTPPNPNDLLSGGSPSAKFERVGDQCVGTVLDFDTQQQRDFKTGAPLFWDDGNPRWQVVVRVQTDQRDPSIEDDTGERRLYLKGQLLKAARAATSKHGGLAQGGRIGVQFVNEEPSTTRGMDPQKIYRVEYAPPIKQVNLETGMVGAGAQPTAEPAAAPRPMI